MLPIVHSKLIFWKPITKLSLLTEIKYNVTPFHITTNEKVK